MMPGINGVNNMRKKIRKNEDLQRGAQHGRHGFTRPITGAALSGEYLSPVLTGA
jgi:hypothetical protein